MKDTAWGSEEVKEYKADQDKTNMSELTKKKIKTQRRYIPSSGRRARRRPIRRCISRTIKLRSSTNNPRNTPKHKTTLSEYCEFISCT